MFSASASRATPLPWQRLFALALGLLFVGLSVQYSFKAVASRSAVVRWREQIQHLDAGDNPYELYLYPNPPIMALILLPIAELPPLAGSLLWFYLKVGMTVLGLYWVFRMIEDPDHPFPAGAKALTVLLSLRPIMGDLSHGNVNLLILFLVVGACYAYYRNRDVLAGVVLALAIACKVTPALFVPYFVWKRAWKTLAGCVLGLGLFLWLVPGCYLGFAENAHLLASWAERMVKPFVIDGVVTSEHNNQSLPGLLYRLLTHHASVSTYVDNQYTPLVYYNFVALDASAVRWILKGCMALFAGLVVWACRTPTAPRRGWRLAAEFSVIVLGMLLFSERTWKHHGVTLLFPFAVLSYYLAAYRPSGRLRGYLIGTLVAVVGLMASTSSGVLKALDEAAQLAQVYGAYVWAYCLLIAALVVVLRLPDPAPAEPSPAAAAE